MNTMLRTWEGSRGWGYRVILVDSLVLTLAAIGLGVVILLLMGRDGTQLMTEKGPIELIQSGMLFATVVCGVLGFLHGRERLACLCIIIAFACLTFLLREFPRCESIDSSFCIDASFKRPATVIARLGTTLMLIAFAVYDRAGLIASFNPRFSWPLGFVLCTLAISQVAEAWHWEAAEEILELYAYTVLFQGTAYIASAFLPRLNLWLSARRAIPIRKTDSPSKAHG